MTNLKNVPIGSTVDTVRTWNPLRADPDDTFKYIDLSAIDQEEKRITDSREVPCGEAPSRARQLVKAGDVLVATVRPNLNGVAKVSDDHDGATASTGFCVLRPRRNSLDSSFLFHWVKSSPFISDMVKKATGASYPAVSDKIIFNSLMPLPPLPEQRRIAAILDKADALRAKRREALAQLDSLTQSIFIEMFGHPQDNPKGFPRKALRHLCSRVTVGYVGPMAEEYVEYGIPLLRSLNIRRGRVDLADLKYVSPEFHSKLSKSEIRPGDVVTVRTGQPGTTAVIPASLGVANCADLIVMTCGAELEPEYLCEALNLWLGDADSIQGQVGAIQIHFNIGRAKELEIPLPLLSEQREFARRVLGVRKQKGLLTASLAEIAALFSSLQHRAFRGEL